MNLESTARVVTDRPARYGKQLASHLSRRLRASWDESADRGQITFAGEEFSGGLTGEVSLTAAGQTLLLQLETTAEHVAQIESVIGRHLVGFGRKEELSVVWERQGGTAGTSYTTADLADPAAPED